MKKIIFGLALGFAVLFGDSNTIKIGVTPYPTAMILENVKSIVEEQGYKLEIIEFDDYIVPNYALNDGEIDANFVQHKPYLEIFNKEKGTNLASAGNIFLAPMAAYSKKIKNIKELKNGSLIFIPSDPVNASRALDLLEYHKIISFDGFDGKLKSVLDITKNPQNVEIREIEAPQLARVLDECDLAVINTNYALVAGLNPINDSLLLENLNSAYINVLVVRSGDEDKPKTKALLKAMQSQKMKDFLSQKFKNVLLPSF